MVKLTRNSFPEDLKRLDQVPEFIFVEGQSLEEIMLLPRIAVVGSRKITPYGRLVTMQLVAALARRGVVIISGLAFGVDSIAHQACLESGGITLAILPASLEKIYPSSHLNLAKQILNSGGSLLSEYEGMDTPMKHQFIARNRLIAALSDAVLITEAAEKSGSLHTASFALELGKPVLAVPGNITSPMSAGTNNLIKAGAVPIHSAQDILNALRWQFPESVKSSPMASPEENIILSLLQSGTSDGSLLLEKSHLEPRIFNQTMTMLEITGQVHALGANHWSV